MFSFEPLNSDGNILQVAYDGVVLERILLCRKDFKKQPDKYTIIDKDLLGATPGSVFWHSLNRSMTKEAAANIMKQYSRVQQVLALAG